MGQYVRLWHVESRGICSTHRVVPDQTIVYVYEDCMPRNCVDLHWICLWSSSGWWCTSCLRLSRSGVPTAQSPPHVSFFSDHSLSPVLLRHDGTPSRDHFIMRTLYMMSPYISVSCDARRADPFEAVAIAALTRTHPQCRTIFRKSRVKAHEIAAEAWKVTLVEEFHRTLVVACEK